MPLSATNLIYNYIYGQPNIQAPSDEGACVGQPQGLSLRYDIFFNLLTAVSYHISVSFHGGSKPPPYAVELNFKAYIQMLSNLIIYATAGRPYDII